MSYSDPDFTDMVATNSRGVPDPGLTQPLDADGGGSDTDGKDKTKAGLGEEPQAEGDGSDTNDKDKTKAGGLGED